MTLHTFEYSVGFIHEAKTRIAVDEMIAAGGVVIGYAIHNYNDDVRERWVIRKDEKAAATVSTDELTLDNIASIERSTTSNSNSPMWRCVTANAEKVNIFKHEDKDKDNFHLFEKKGWADVLLAMPMYEQVDTTDSPIAIAMKKDGKWWSIVAVMQAPSEVAKWFGNPPTDMDDIPWDNESDSDSWYTENPDDGESTKALRKMIDDMRAEDKTFTAHGDAVSKGCITCGNEWKSLNREGRCSQCQQVWDS